MTVACPGCGARETFRAEDLGRVVRCNRCDAVHEATAIGCVPGRADPVGAAARDGEGRGPVAAQHPDEDPGVAAAGVGSDEAPSELDRLREEADSLRTMAAEAHRLRADCEALEEQARARADSEESLRAQLDEVRGELRRLESEAAVLREGAASAERLEGELQAAGAEVARLRADCHEARAAAAAATGEVESLLAHSSSVQEGFCRVLADIEAGPSERLIPPREADRLRGRLAELEGQVAEAMAARRAVEEEAARALQVRESELVTLRGELRAMRAQRQELAGLDREERPPRVVRVNGRIDHEVQPGLAEFVSSSPRRPGHPAVAGLLTGPGRVKLAPGPRETVAIATAPASRREGPACISAPEIDLALERIDLSEILPWREGAAVALPELPFVGGPDSSSIEPEVPAGPVGDPGSPDPTGTVAEPPIERASEAIRPQQKAEVLDLIARGRKKKAEILARRMVELIRNTAGELSADLSTWMTVVGQLQAEQGDLDGARSTFDRKNAIYRDAFGERHHRYLSCVANSAEALLACGDKVGARVLFEVARTGLDATLGTSHPLSIAMRQRLAGLSVPEADFWTSRVFT
jgi:hypothetical protein